MRKHVNLFISLTENYSGLITLNQLQKANSSYKCINIFHIHNQYKYIKSRAYIGLAYSSTIAGINGYYYYNHYYYHSQKHCTELNKLYNVLSCNNYILLPLPIKINNKNIFLLTLCESSENDKHTNIIFMYDHKIEYTYLTIKKGILYNPHNEFLLNSIKEIIMYGYNIINNIINSKLLLNQIKN